MMLLAVSAASFGIIGSFATTAIFGGWALIRGGKGDKALSATTMLTATWDQTKSLIDTLQEETNRQHALVLECEKKCADMKAVGDLALVKLALLERDHAKLGYELDAIRAELHRAKVEVAELKQENVALRGSVRD